MNAYLALMNSDCVFWALLGFFVGTTITLLLQRDTVIVHETTNVTNREKNDPSNWWKYGGDPFANSLDEEDHDLFSDGDYPNR